MPLIKSKSRKAFVSNLKAELAAGKPRDQALAIAYAVKRRARAPGGGIFDYSGVAEAMPENIAAEAGKADPVTRAVMGIPKSVFWDTPVAAVEAAKRTPYGLTREDFTDVPADTSPDPHSPLGGVGIRVPRGEGSYRDPMIKPALETAMNVMGGTAFSAPAKGAGEVLGAGPRDPRLWHGISKVKLPKPIEEMSSVHVPVEGAAAERVISPAELQGQRLLPLIGDRTRAGTNLTRVNGYQFANPVEMQGGHGFMANNVDTGAAWAAAKPMARGLGNLVRREAAEAPVTGVYTAMGERSGDFSHHVSDTLAEMLPHTKVTNAGAGAFDQAMLKVAPDWPGVASEGLRQYLVSAPGELRSYFAKLMDTARFQREGFPSVAEARLAVTDPRLLNEQTGAAGLSMARLDPSGKTFSTPGQHLSYDTNIPGQYVGGFPASVPKEVMFPDIVDPLEKYRSALPGYKPTVDYLMQRTPTGLPKTQLADQKWVDTVSKHLEDRGFTLGAGANDKRAAGVIGANEISKEAQGLRRYYSQRSWGTEEEARDAIKRRILDENQKYNSMFPPTDPKVVDELKFVRHGNGVKISQAGTSTRKPVEIFEEPTGNAPAVDWTARDLMNKGSPASAMKNYGRGRGEARQGYVSLDDLPKEKLAGGKRDYDWSELQSNRTDPPPATVRINKNGTMSIMDGNHRIAYWREQGYDQVPAFIIDERAPGKVLGAGATDKRAAGVTALNEVDRILDAERSLKGATREPGPAAAVPERPAPAGPAPELGPGGGGPSGTRSLAEAQATAARWAGARKPLEGIPGALKIGEDHFVPGPIAKVHDVAEDYMRGTGREYTPPTQYHPIDPEHSQAIAQAYEDMKHTPKDPATVASYNALIDETKAQYEAIKKTGLKIEPIPPGAADPYAANPRLAAVDVAENNHLWFFPTEQGFGTVNKISDNPMLRKTGEKIGDMELTANDMFRVVHDYFGHLKEGHGFRAAGEDNAWRAHSAMYSDLARPAMTTETRGQNSWVNYGPHGEKNRTASGADTVYADQKVGLMPNWTMYDKGKEPPMMYHGSAADYVQPDLSKIGSGQGQMAYGAGYYGSSKEAVAKHYRDMQAKDHITKNGKKSSLSDLYGDVYNPLMIMGASPKSADAAASRIADMIGDGMSLAKIRQFSPPVIVDPKEWEAALKAAKGYTNRRFKGHMYQWAIETDPEKMLDWNKNLNKHSSYVQERLTEPMTKSVQEQLQAIDRSIARLKSGDHRYKGRPGGDLMAERELERLQVLAGTLDARNLSGREMYKRTGLPANTEEEAYKQASTRLRDMGIPGLRYRDASSVSKAADIGVPNYVVWDPKVLRLLRKYGIATGLPTAGLAAGAAQEERATGGSVNQALTIARNLKRARGGKVHVGPIMGETGGRADKVKMEVPDGSYVLTADHVSGMGEGNTLAGFKKLKGMFPKSCIAYKALKAGGPVKRGAVPIYAADGEFVISPEEIKERWGDLDEGHRILDHWQTTERKKLIRELATLAPPAQD